LQEAFFGGKMTQQTQSLQFDQLASNGIPTASARARSPSQLRSRRGIAKA
jgi:hypothetical protein